MVSDNLGLTIVYITLIVDNKCWNLEVIDNFNVINIYCSIVLIKEHPTCWELLPYISDRYIPQKETI